MKIGAFLPERSWLLASLPWLQSSLTLSALSAVVVGTIAVRFHPEPRISEERGREIVIEFAPIVTQADSQPQRAAAEQAEPDQQATPEMQEVQSHKTEIDLPTEQASPSEAEAPDLRMAQERTRTESETAPETDQATEAAEARPQMVHSEASAASDAAIEQRAEAPQETAAAPEIGNSAEAARRIEAWQKAIFAHIGRFKTYPEVARKRRIKGDIVVAFVLDRSGTVSDVRIATSSGETILDQAAIEVLRHASPLPTPPQDLRGESIELLLPMRYQLR